MQSNRTRQAQKQLISFMKDAGCDLKQIQHDYQESLTTEHKPFKKLSFKQCPQEPYQVSKIQRHKRIEKTTKRPEKCKVKVTKSESSNRKLEQYIFQESNCLAKNSNISLEKDHSQIVMIQQPNIEVNQSNKKHFLFPLCVNKANDNFYGYFGHSTVLVNESIVEGGYYMQVTILNPSHPNHPKGKQFQSSVRIGLCKSNYRLLVPLGGQNSYCYKSKDGSILHSTTKVESILGEAYGPGDVIGVYLYMSPPYRYMKDNNIHNIPNEGSKLIFYKNGVVSCELQNINQCFYNLGVSLFNWANVNIKLKPPFTYPIKLDHKPVNEIFQQESAYTDVKTC